MNKKRRKDSGKGDNHALTYSLIEQMILRIIIKIINGLKVIDC